MSRVVRQNPTCLTCGTVNSRDIFRKGEIGPIASGERLGAPHRDGGLDEPSTDQRPRRPALAPARPAAHATATDTLVGTQTGC